MTHQLHFASFTIPHTDWVCLLTVFYLKFETWKNLLIWNLFGPSVLLHDIFSPQQKASQQHIVRYSKMAVGIPLAINHAITNIYHYKELILIQFFSLLNLYGVNAISNLRNAQERHHWSKIIFDPYSISFWLTCIFQFHIFVQFWPIDKSVIVGKCGKLIFSMANFIQEFIT